MTNRIAAVVLLALWFGAWSLAAAAQYMLEPLDCTRSGRLFVNNTAQTAQFRLDPSFKLMTAEGGGEPYYTLTLAPNSRLVACAP